ncbi:MAG: hypothetical protein ACK5TA_00790, partial [bacterium]
MLELGMLRFKIGEIRLSTFQLSLEQRNLWVYRTAKQLPSKGKQLLNPVCRFGVAMGVQGIENFRNLR